MTHRRYNTAAKQKAIREACQECFYTFVKAMFLEMRGYKWVHNWHHKTIVDALMDVYHGRTKRLVLNLPPRYSKTELAVVMFIAWSLGNNPDAEFIHTSYGESLAAGNTANARAVVETELYKIIFPTVRLSKDSKAKGDWKTTDGGVVYAQGSGGGITGFGAGKLRAGFGGAIIIDDPHKPTEAASDVIRKGVIDWFGNTVESRKNDPQNTPIIVIMQRLHEADLAGYLAAGGNGETWHQVKIPALQADGTALWPLKHTAEQLRNMQRANPYVFAGQYQQEPAPLAGGEFKPDMLEIVDAIPAGTRFFRGWDLAGTKGGGDYTAGGKLGVCPDGTYILADMARDQLDPGDVERLIKNTAAADGKVCNIAIPQDPGQAGKAQIRGLTTLLGGYPLTSKPVSGDKVTRARPFAAQVNIGNVKMLRGDWNDALKAEMRNFPNGKNDDQVDALSLAFDAATSGNTGLLDYYAQQAEELRRLREG